MGKLYINRNDTVFKTMETVNEYTSKEKKQAREDLKEYQISELPESATYHLSTRPTKGWKDR